MADVYSVSVGSTTVGANARTTEVGFDHGTPALGFYKITLTGIETSYTAANSTFHKAIAALEGFAELYGVGTPASSNVVFVCNDNSANDGSTAGAADGSWGAAEAAIDDATGGTSTIAAITASGASIA
jgi:hypothetical protein